MDTGKAADIFQFGQFRLDRRKGGLFRQDNNGGLHPVDIGSRACDVLSILIAHHGELVEKDAIMAAVWPDVVVTDANLTVHISALRRILGAGEGGASWIQTVAGRGYRFVGGVVRLPSPAPHVVAMPREATDARPPAKIRPRWSVGRAAPLQAFSRLFNKAVAGDRQVVFVTGEAGIGKTTLIGMASAQASGQGFGILSGRCAEVFGAEEAFLPLIDALTEACRGPDRDRVLQPLRDHAPTWLVQIPGLLDARDRAAVQTEIFGATRERMLREFCDFIEALEDGASLAAHSRRPALERHGYVECPVALPRGERRAAVMLLASYRPTHHIDAERSVSTLHRDLQLRGQATELALDRLSEDEVEEYLQRRFGNTALATALGGRVFARTQGQPLFVTSLVDYFVDRQIIVERDGDWHAAAIDTLQHEGIPDNLRTMIVRQVDQLAADEQRLLEIASAAGPEFSGAIVAAGTWRRPHRDRKHLRAA